MNLTKEQFEAALTILDRVNMLGETDDMAEDEKMDIVESYCNCNYLFFETLNNRPVIIYEDDAKTHYMWADNERDLTDKEIDALFEQKQQA